MRRFVLSIVIGIAVQSGVSTPGVNAAASRPCEQREVVTKAQAQPNDSSFAVGGTKTVKTCTEGETEPATIRELLGWASRSGACGSLAVVSDVSHQELCESEPRQPITQEIVLRALRRVTLPEPTLLIQPPGGKTLVNFDTLFRTNAEPFTRTVRLLGQRVSLRITPTSFTWVHGDGTQQASTGPGLKYESERPMTDYVRHQYEDAHVTMRPHVEVTYSAEFRVGQGAWRELVGTVTSAGPPAPVKILEARPTLVG